MKRNKILSIIIISIFFIINLFFCNNAISQYYVQYHTDVRKVDFFKDNIKNICYEIEEDSIYISSTLAIKRYNIEESDDSSMIVRNRNSYKVYPRFKIRTMGDVLLKDVMSTFITEIDSIYNCVFRNDTSIKVITSKNGRDSLISVSCFQVSCEGYSNTKWGIGGKVFYRFNKMLIEKETGLPLFFTEEISWDNKFSENKTKYEHQIEYITATSNHHPAYFKKNFQKCYSNDFYTYFNKGVVILDKNDINQYFTCDSIPNIELIRNISIVNSTFFDLLDGGEYVVFYKIGYGLFKIMPTLSVSKSGLEFSNWNAKFPDFKFPNR